MGIRILLDYHEEDTQVDYKLTCEISNEKFWVDITKDIMAFANTKGGYIVIGVKNLTYDIIGIELPIIKIMQDANNILQKVNKYLEPQITRLRSKVFKRDEKKIIVILTPESNEITHIFSKDGNFVFESGKSGCAFYKGTLYVRRSAGNHMVDSRDFDEIVLKRITKFKESILGKIAQVVRAPQNTEMLFVSRESDDGEGKFKFIIEDSPDAIPVKGLSFSISPKTYEEKIASWIAISSTNPKALPPVDTMWEWYHSREKINIKNSQKCIISKFSILLNLPAFYWIKDCPAQMIKEMLFEVLSYEIVRGHFSNILQVANFLGASTYRMFVNKLGEKNMLQIPRRYRKYLKDDIFSIVEMGRLRSKYQKKTNISDSVFGKYLLDELNLMVKECFESKTDAMKIFDIISLDCFLYAREDKYKIAHK